MIHLAVGHLEIDWGKNQFFRDHSALFQGEQDVASVPYLYAVEGEPNGFKGEVKWKPLIEYKEGLSKPFPQVIERLNLLGHTYQQSAREFASLARLHDFDDTRFTFAALSDALATVDITSLSLDYGEGGEEFGEFFRRELSPRLGLEAKLQESPTDYYAISEAMENLSAYTVLQLLARNPQAASLPVQWAFNDIEIGGYARRGDFVRALDPPTRFLIVTEGSSDAAILRHALKLLRPHLADFFDFVDMEEGYPFSGTGNVYRFVQGLISIAVQNKILVLFDNDAEGLANQRRCEALHVPDNMRILRLPDLSAFKNFPTIGPDGERLSDINGRAAAIECYLDLNEKARVRWTGYNKEISDYQGALENKAAPMRAFLKQRHLKGDYDYTRIGQVLDILISAAVSVSETEVTRELHRTI